MSTGPATPEEEARYNLKPLEDVPFIGKEESDRLNAEYEASRRAYRLENPITGTGSETRVTKP